jgi:hypothetical protein
VLVVLSPDTDDEEARERDGEEDIKKEPKEETTFNYDVVFPAGVEGLSVTIDRTAPGDFKTAPTDEDAIPVEFEIVDDEEEFTLSLIPARAPAAPSSATGVAEDKMRALDTIVELPDDLLEPMEKVDPVKPDPVDKVDRVEKPDPLKDLYDED